MGGSKLVVTDQSGAAHEAVIRQVQMKTVGPLRAVAQLDGEVNAGGGRLLAVRVNLAFFAGLPTVRARITLTNPEAATHPEGFWDLGDPGSILIRDAALHLRPTAGEAPVRVACSPELDAPFHEFDVPLELYQDSSGGDRWESSNHINRERRIPVSFRGYRLRGSGAEASGLRATPVLRWRAGSVDIAVAVPHFWQNFPKALEADAGGLVISPVPRTVRATSTNPGRRTEDARVLISVGADPVPADPLDWCRSPRCRASIRLGRWRLARCEFLAPLTIRHMRHCVQDAAIEGPDTLRAQARGDRRVRLAALRRDLR